MFENNKAKYRSKDTAPSYCVACLSSDRKLINVQRLNEYAHILMIISSIKTSSNLYLCWECVAMLRKIQQFRLRVQTAQNVLAEHFTQKQKTTIKSLSRLSSSTSDNVIFITHTAHANIDNKQSMTIDVKHEDIHFGDDCNIDQEDAQDDHHQEIKKEEKPQTKSVKRNKVSHYKIVYGRDVFKKSLLRKKFAIKSEEVGLWLERERDSQFYKSFKFRCKLCYHGFNSKEKFNKHHKDYHDPGLGKHECPTCGARFATAGGELAHERAHAVAYACARCGFHCYSARRLNAHIDQHRQLQCVYCELCLPDVRAFQQHYRAAHAAFVCDHCGKTCRTKYLLEKHIVRHSARHACASCGRQYASRGALGKHRAAQHGGGAAEGAYCVRCDKQFASAPLYRRHVLAARAHAHETRRAQAREKVPCPECGNAYSRRAYMMNHYRHVHMNQSKHYCAACDRHFLNRTRYVEHVRFHHEGAKREKNKLCNVCGRGFATNRILSNHIRTHSGERPFSCAHCAASFTQKHSMLAHVRHVHLHDKRRAAGHL